MDTSGNKVLDWADSSQRKFDVARKAHQKKEIAANINKEMNLHLTEIQVSNRYKTLMRSYKQVVDNNKKTGSAKKTHSYENELGKLLKDNPNIRLVHTLSSSALVESSSEGKSSLSPSPPSSESSSRASSPVNPVSSRKKNHQLLHLPLWTTHQMLQKRPQTRTHFLQRKVQSAKHHLSSYPPIWTRNLPSRRRGSKNSCRRWKQCIRN